MNPKKITPNMRVKTADTIDPTRAFPDIDDQVLSRREADRIGFIKAAVPGYGTEVFWVTQTTGTAVYSFEEFEPY